MTKKKSIVVTISTCENVNINCNASSCRSTLQLRNTKSLHKIAYFSTYMKSFEEPNLYVKNVNCSLVLQGGLQCCKPNKPILPLNYAGLLSQNIFSPANSPVIVFVLVYRRLCEVLLLITPVLLFTPFYGTIVCIDLLYLTQT